MKAKLYVSWTGHAGYPRPFLPLFDVIEEYKKADVVMFTGGSDIDPTFFYNHPKHEKTYCNQQRDVFEGKLIARAIEDGKKILGICRGAQLLCAVSGGFLAQHIEGHQSGHHRIITSTGEEFLESTCHHQMMVPWDVDHRLLAWTERLSDTYEDGQGKQIPGIEVEPEIVYFPKVKGLGIQGHPEFLPTYSLVNEYHRALVKEFLL